MSNELKISGVSKVEKSYEKQITFTRGEETYYATLYWESNDGFELAFVNADGKGIDTPEWAINWEEEEIESLEFTLDDLTDAELEASYL
jgi:hypothetical protein